MEAGILVKSLRKKILQTNFAIQCLKKIRGAFSGVPKGKIRGSGPPAVLKYSPRDLSKIDVKLMGGGGGRGNGVGKPLVAEHRQIMGTNFAKWAFSRICECLKGVAQKNFARPCTAAALGTPLGAIGSYGSLFWLLSLNFAEFIFAVSETLCSCHSTMANLALKIWRGRASRGPNFKL